MLAIISQISSNLLFISLILLLIFWIYWLYTTNSISNISINKINIKIGIHKVLKETYLISQNVLVNNAINFLKNKTKGIILLKIWD